MASASNSGYFIEKTHGFVAVRFSFFAGLNETHFFKPQISAEYCGAEHDDEDDDELHRMFVETVFYVGKGEIPVNDGAHDKYKENNCKE